MQHKNTAASLERKGTFPDVSPGKASRDYLPAPVYVRLVGLARNL